MKFVNLPNNPINASTVLIAKNAPTGVVAGLERLGVEPIFGDELKYDIQAVRNHIDTQICHVGGCRFVASPHLLDHYKKILPDAHLLPGESVGQAAYPDDAAYNVANTGKFAIHNFKFTDKVLLSELKCEKIYVSQGYAKCSLCIIDEKSVITEDAGIAHTLERHNIDVLKISAGDVRLPGLNYGFLGGASGKLRADLIAFAGDITTHRDYKDIFNFCLRKNVEPVSLCGGNLVDIGSIVPVAEKE